MTPDSSVPLPEEPTNKPPVTRKLRLPMASGRVSALILVLCFGVSTALLLTVGTAVRLPIWIDFELVLASWWLMWIAALAHLLYHGKRVSDDHAMPQPRNWLAGMSRGRQGTGSSPGRGWGWDLAWIGADGEGCAWFFAVLAAICLLFVVAWLLVEVVIPVLALIVYALVRGMLARIANEKHNCAGRFGPALLWGTVWATVYTAPLALLVWVVHLIAVQPH